MNMSWKSSRVGWVLLIVLGLAAVVVMAGPAAVTAWAQEAAKEEHAEAPQNFLVWVALTSGIIGVVILCLSIWFVAQVCRLFYELRPMVVVPPDVIAQVEDLINNRDFKAVFEVVKNDDSFFSRALSTGISELPNGLAEARDVMDRTGDSMTVEMEKKISMLAVMGSLGPMIGLLGTLKGMIASFGEIARSGTQMKAAKVAEGISEALLLTFEGVALSVPAIFFFALFRNRVAALSSSGMLEADQFLRHFAHAARSKTPTTPAAAAATKPATK